MVKEKINFISQCFEEHISTLSIFLAIMFAAFSIFNPRVFLSVNNLQSIGFQLSELGIFSIAMCLAIIPGGINLSIVAMANLTAILMTFFIKYLMLSSISSIFLIIVLTILVGLIIGLVLGLINGLIISFLEIPEILATLVTMNIYTGLAIGITKGVTLASIPKEFLVIGSSSLFGIPVPMIIFISLALIIRYTLMNNKFGWNIFLIGTNKQVIKLNGVSLRKNMLLTHTIIGLISAIAAIVILARTNSASAQYGNTYILSSILVVILGGVSILGGKGFFSGIILSVVFLQVLSTGFNLVLQGVSGGNFFRDFVWGFLLLFMIFINKNTEAMQKIVSNIKLQFKK